MVHTKFLDWAIAKVNALGAATSASVTDSIELEVPGSNPGLYQASAVRGMLNTK